MEVLDIQDEGHATEDIVLAVRNRCIKILSVVDGDLLRDSCDGEAPISDQTIEDRLKIIAHNVNVILDKTGRGSIDQVTQCILARLYVALLAGNAISPTEIDPILRHFDVCKNKVSPGRLKLNKIRHSFDRSTIIDLILKLEGMSGSSFYYLDSPVPEESENLADNSEPSFVTRKPRTYEARREREGVRG